eukprot:TRINITY_DN103294_c0_g1_i1.p1 TRINITY_DN103294_c0_g1~~TRINITY_DN103294_c0_g1_i1.p1  ORF type:complete len:350 (-),score=83.09 TRINITY_DN103294_c0_g1_i1:208-1179(-)
MAALPPVGTRLHAIWSGDGEYYKADVIDVAKGKKWKSTPVMVSYAGHPGEDAWLALSDLKSKAYGLPPDQASKTPKSAPSKPAKASEAKKKEAPKAKTSAPKPTRKPADPEAVLTKLAECKVVPVIKLDEAAHAVPLATALKEGGIKVAEITFRTACAAEAIQEVSKNVEDVCVGAGTVLTVAQVDEAVTAGADFIVSPGFDGGVARRCQQIGILYLPGVVTPTEVMMVSGRYKLKTLKFFPAANFGGVDTLKSYSAVFQGIKFMPTGGVSEGNLTSFLSLPNVIAAGGSWMVSASAITEAAKTGDWSKIKDGADKASKVAHS